MRQVLDDRVKEGDERVRDSKGVRIDCVREWVWDWARDGRGRQCR